MIVNIYKLYKLVKIIITFISNGSHDENGENIIFCLRKYRFIRANKKKSNSAENSATTRLFIASDKYYVSH